MTEPTTAAKAAAPKTVKMPRAVHELITGTKPENRIAPATVIDEETAKLHKLDAKAIERLIDSGAVDTVDVLKG